MDIGLWPDFEFVSVPQELGIRVYADGLFLQLQPVIRQTSEARLESRHGLELGGGQPRC